VVRFFYSCCLLFFFFFFFFFFSSRRRHTRCLSDWSSDVCSSDLSISIQRNERAWSARAASLSTSWTHPSRLASRPRWVSLTETRSEERRVGKECRTRWAA